MLRVLCAIALLAAPLTAQEHNITGTVAIAVYATAEPLAELLTDLLHAEIENDAPFADASWLLRVRLDYRERPGELLTERLVVTCAVQLLSMQCR